MPSPARRCILMALPGAALVGVLVGFSCARLSAGGLSPTGTINVAPAALLVVFAGVVSGGAGWLAQRAGCRASTVSTVAGLGLGFYGLALAAGWIVGL